LENGKKSAENRLDSLNIILHPPPSPLGAYVEAVQSGNLLFQSGTLPIENKKPKYLGVIGKNLTADEGRQAVRLACLNSLAVAKEHLGSLNRVSKVIRLTVFLVTASDFKDHAMIADGASELLLDIFGKEKLSTRSVIGVATLPLGVPAVTEIAFEVEK
jgi:enamine deaminase RidA (YjgF/YER057c/UK114 family)